MTKSVELEVISSVRQLRKGYAYRFNDHNLHSICNEYKGKQLLVTVSFEYV